MYSCSKRLIPSLRYDRHRQDTTAVVIYHKGQRLGAARLLDAVANGLLRRKELP